MTSQILLFSFLLVTVSCTSEVMSEAEARKEIMALHDAQRTYHFEKMAEDFAGQLADNFISANRGEIDSVSYEEHVERYKTYFSYVEFVKWDDVNPPIIRFSDDNSLAYTIVKKDVVLTYPDEDGETITDSTRYAWTAIYKYADGEWKIESVASTNRESVSY